jgi:hypothetical protein
MSPNAEQRLERIQEVTDGALRYYLTAYLRTGEGEAHTVNERDLLMSYAMQAANVQVLLEGDELDDPSMLRDRHEVVDQYLHEVEENPWTPPK